MSETSDPLDHPSSRRPPMSNPRREHIRMVDQDETLALPSEDGIQYEHWFTISDTKPHTAQTYSTVPDKGHFVLLDLKSPDSNHTIQILFQIDSAASCIQASLQYALGYGDPNQNCQNTLCQPTNQACWTNHHQGLQRQHRLQSYLSGH